MPTRLFFLLAFVSLVVLPMSLAPSSSPSTVLAASRSEVPAIPTSINNTTATLGTVVQDEAPNRSIYAVAVRGDHAYIGVGRQFVVLDVANPKLPYVVARTNPLAGVVRDIVLEENYAYVAHTEGLSVVNIAVLKIPVEVGFYAKELSVYLDVDVVVAGNYAYVSTNAAESLHVVNISNPEKPVEVGIFEDLGGFDIAVMGDYLYLVKASGGLSIFDISNINTPIQISNILPSQVAGGNAIAVVGRYAYVAGLAGLSIIDATDAAKPIEVGTSYYQTQEPNDVVISNSYAYVAGLQVSVLDVANPSTPRQVSVTSIAPAYDISVSRKYAYIANQSALHIVNMNNPSAPIREGLYEPEEEADSDGDGLLDVWESQGYDYNDDGVIDLNLRTLGANPLRKDIFVQVDWFKEANGFSHKPDDYTMRKVQEAFKNAPVSNPNGTSGIDLHILFANEIEQNEENRELGLVKSLENEMPCDYSWEEFDEIKERNFPKERSTTFHYAIFAHDLPEFPCINNDRPSGISRGNTDRPSERGGSDFIVALGNGEKLIANPQLLRNIRAQTFMHELGHNLGLGHGGVILDNDGKVVSADNTNYKPNYLSVMNYYFQKFGIRKRGFLGRFYDGNLDYSKFDESVLRNIEESSDNENRPLSRDDIMKDYGTRLYCQDSGDGIPIDDLTRPLDWNRDGVFSTALAFNINCDRDNVYSTLSTVNEWNHLKYTGGLVGSLGNAITLPNVTSLRISPEPSQEETTTIEHVNLEPVVVYVPYVLQ